MMEHGRVGHCGPARARTTDSFGDSAVVMIIDQRPAEIGLVDSIWHAGSRKPGAFVSAAAVYCELVVSGHGDRPVVTLRGPATRTAPMTYASGGEWWGIRFKFGARFACLPGCGLVDRAISLPVTGERSFTWHDTEIPLPDYDSAEATVHRLVTAGLLVADPVVEATWQGGKHALSERSLQRRFKQMTGLSQRTARQIDRARTALRMLQEGTSIFDTVHELGFSDQAHLTRSLHRWTGLTPGQAIRQPGASFMA